MKGNSTFKIILLFAVFSLMIPAYVLTAEAAKPTTCTGTISSGTFKNIVVPSGESCVLLGSVVVNGNFRAEGASDIAISGTSIGGNVLIKGSTGGVSVIRADIGGHLQIERHSGIDCIGLGSNTIGGNLKLHNNAGNGCINTGLNIIAGNFQLTKNNIIDEFLVELDTVGGNFICLENEPQNPSIFGLTVAGKIVGDCPI